MSTPLIRHSEFDDGQAATSAQAEYGLPVTQGVVTVQMAAVLGVLTGLWVAVSPWFITLQQGGTNANIVNLVSGLAVAGIGALALASPRAFASLQLGSALLGVWLVIAGPILSQKYTIADPMFWSNSVAGAVLIALAAVGLGVLALRRPVRR
jgi:hypothetical protein